MKDWGRSAVSGNRIAAGVIKTYKLSEDVVFLPDIGKQGGENSWKIDLQR